MAPLHEQKLEAYSGPRDPELWIGGSPVRLHFDMLWEAFSERPEYLHLIKISKAPEWAVAATILVLESLEPNLRSELFENNWHNVPVENWIRALKPLLPLAERSLVYGKYRGLGCRNMRNIMNVTSRLDEKADWNKELLERAIYQAQKCDWQDDTAPFTSWRETLTRLSLELAHAHISKMGSERRVEDIDEWWQARHHAIPSGSSSERKTVQDNLLKDPLFNPSDRPNKKAVSESWDDDHLLSLILSEPDTHCRLSTKREPGNKNRPVHANNDASFLVESFALVHAEKEMDDVLGCCGRQDPQRVMAWIQKSIDTEKEGGVWLSIDYPNYCTFHAKWELSIVSETRAQAWSKTVQSRITRKQKELCSVWIALGHFNSIMKLEGEDSFMINENGLYSGQRATLLDHNYMHRATSQAAVETVKSMNWPCDPTFRSFTGDDEDAHFLLLIEAIAYANAHGMNGNTFQSAKQASGRHSREAIHDRPSFVNIAGDIVDLNHNGHSYLQRDMSRKSMPARPLARIVATLASGNWYVEPGIWFDSAIASTSDNFWECVTRGMDLRIAQVLAKTFLDRLMIVRPTLEDDPKAIIKELEWWEYANPEDHPLWRGTTAGTKKTPLLMSKPDPHPCWPSKATDAWMLRVSRVLDGLRPSRIEQYKTYLLRESVGSSYHHYRQRSLRDCARAIWPERKSKIIIATRELPQPPPVMRLVRLFKDLHSRRRPITEDEQLARLGIDVYLFNLVGATKNLFESLKPSDWARFSTLTIKKKLIPELELLDGSIQSWASNTESISPEIHLDWRKPERTSFYVVYAGNGAGKSWIANRFKTICDMDVPVYAKVGWQLRAQRYVKSDRSDIVEALVTLDWAKKYDNEVIVTQWPPEYLIDAAELRGYTLDWLGYDPGEDIRRERLEAREYADPTRVQELMDLADTLYSTLPKDAPIYSNYVQVLTHVGIL